MSDASSDLLAALSALLGESKTGTAAKKEPPAPPPETGDDALARLAEYERLANS